MKILCMGDSFTFGYGVSCAQRWSDLCGKLLGMELVNCAVSGNTTGGMLARLEYQMDRVKPGMVLLIGGFNDIMLSGSDQAARSNLGAMAHITAGRGAIPVVGTPPLPCSPIQVKWTGLTDLEQAGERAVVYQDWIRKMCAMFGYPLLDLHRGLAGLAAREGRPLRDYYLDGLHMNGEGHRAIAELTVPFLGRLMEGQGVQ